MSDPIELPEVQWTFRRLFTYGVTFLAVVIIGFIVWRVQDPAVLKIIALALCGLIALLSVLYLAGATATDLARITSAYRNPLGSQQS